MSAPTANQKPNRIRAEALDEIRIAGVPTAKQKPNRIGAEALDEIRTAFGLSTLELAAFFQVTRSTMQQWRTSGVPAKRAADIDRLRELAKLFLRRFIAARVPRIVRIPARGLGGKSVLEVVADRGVEPVFAYLEQLFARASP